MEFLIVIAYGFLATISLLVFRTKNNQSKRAFKNRTERLIAQTTLHQKQITSRKMKLAMYDFQQQNLTTSLIPQYDIDLSNLK